MSRTLRAGLVGLAAASAVLSATGAAHADASLPQLKAVGMTLNGLMGAGGTPSPLTAVTGGESALSPLTGGNPLSPVTGKLPIG
ncbi:hypothetical protein GCM10027445_38270 [Amycolatopsis endophytica]|uniref:ATP-binding protein n=1 Tax=Amycolatopsis endophytica TaxID=860233 RepID=A0A853B7D6_9PSEU|nr:hypothetical protein [Amycolatopsis endophytica]NYI90900.1 hypothetical protein [Amycolatopsis endophytica]